MSAIRPHVPFGTLRAFLPRGARGCPPPASARTAFLAPVRHRFGLLGPKNSRILRIFELSPPPRSTADGQTVHTASLRPALILDGPNDPSPLRLDPFDRLQSSGPRPNRLGELLELIRGRVKEVR